MNLVLQKFLNQVTRVAWSNFLDGSVLLRWVAALALLVALVWAAWGWGELVIGIRPWRWANERLFVTIGTGLAVIVPLLFIAALIGVYNLPLVGAIWLAGICAPAVAARDSRALAAGLISIGRAVREMPVMWAFLFLFSISALLPPVHWDEVMYHLTYPQQWVAAGRLTVDPYAWYPFYTWNWEILQGVALMVHSETLVHLLGWLAGALATVAVRIFALRLGVRPGLAVVAAVAFALTPTIQLYLDSGMIDIPLMFYISVSLYAFTLVPLAGDAPEPGRAWLAAALCSGMFVGMKITGMVYIPLFVALGAYRLRARVLPFLVAFALSGATWYGYNLGRSGDPAPPLFSLLLHRHALYWSSEDVAWHEADHERGRIHGLSQLVSLPARLIRHPPPPTVPPAPLHDGPLLGYILIFPLSVLCLRESWRRKLPEPLVGAWFGAFVFVATSTLLVRYASFIPLAVVCSALLIDMAAQWLEARRRVPRMAPLLVGTALLVGPTPYALLAAGKNFHFRIPRTDEEREKFQEAIEPSVASLPKLKRVAKPPATVYLTQNGLRYNYEKAGYAVVGNVTRPGRFPDFRRALAADTASRFLAGFGVDYLVVDKPYAQFYIGLAPPQLAAAISADSGFAAVYDDSATAIYRVAGQHAASARRDGR